MRKRVAIEASVAALLLLLLAAGTYEHFLAGPPQEASPPPIDEMKVGPSSDGKGVIQSSKSATDLGADLGGDARLEATIANYRQSAMRESMLADELEERAHALETRFAIEAPPPVHGQHGDVRGAASAPARPGKVGRKYSNEYAHELKQAGDLRASSTEQADAANALSEIDTLIHAMPKANIAFNAPKSMNVEASDHITLRLSADQQVAQLERSLKASGDKIGDTIAISKVMEARLTSSSFKITANSPEQQPVGSTGVTQWDWEITPTKTGVGDLHLTLSATMIVDGSPTERQIQTYDKDIQVSITAGQWVSGFFASY